MPANYRRTCGRGLVEGGSTKWGRVMASWALICSLAILPTECQLKTADRWFQISPDRPAKVENIRADLVRLKAFDPRKQYVKIFKYDGSLGTDGYIFYPCNPLLSDPDEQLSGDAAKGSCLN